MGMMGVLGVTKGRFITYSLGGLGNFLGDIGTVVRYLEDVRGVLGSRRDQGFYSLLSLGQGVKGKEISDLFPSLMDTELDWGIRCYSGMSSQSVELSPWLYCLLPGEGKEVENLFPFPSGQFLGLCQVEGGFAGYLFSLGPVVVPLPHPFGDTNFHLNYFCVFCFQP